MKSKIVKMKVSELVQDFSLYPRTCVYEGHVYELRESLKAGAALPPIVADLTSKRVTDGFHRTSAYLKESGPDALVDVMLVDYPDEAAMFRDTIARNAQHGRRLTTADLARCASMAKAFKVTREELAGLMHVTRDRLKDITVQRVATGLKGNKVIVRRAQAHLTASGKPLTEAQEAVSQKIGGQTALYHAQQLVMLIESDSLPDDDRLFDALRKLATLLEEKMAAA